MGADDTEMACCPPLIVARPIKQVRLADHELTQIGFFVYNVPTSGRPRWPVPTNIEERDAKRYDKTSDL